MFIDFLLPSILLQPWRPVAADAEAGVHMGSVANKSSDYALTAGHNGLNPNEP